MPEPQGMLLFFGIVAISILIEIVLRRRSGAGYDFSAMGASLFIMVGQQILNPLLTYALTGALLFAAYAVSPFQMELGNWQHWAIAFFLVEFTYYWQHRWGHTIRWMWANHAVHHSPNEIALPSAFRLGWTSLIAGTWLLLIPLSFLGVHPVMIVTLMSLNLRFQFFLHTELIGRLGPLEWIFNTPSNHRVHHSSRPEYLDKNFGGVLMIFDHLFGTYAAEVPSVDMRYGLTEPIHSKNPFVILFTEWGNLFRDVKQERTVKGVLTSAFGRPGAHQDTSTALKQIPAE
ncbi:MAG: sterol desaturase family protein [Pseudomonadota bacterium]